MKHGPLVLHPEDLLAAALRRTGLTDLEEPNFREALKVLVDSCNIEAGLSFIGKTAARGHILDLLETRLKLMDYWQEKPYVQEQEVLTPLIITGTPKSGSTFLHRLLALDNSNRVPHMWEVMFPLPPPMSVTFASDPRIAEADKRLRWLRWTHPDIAEAHPIGAGIPQECGAILSYALQSFAFLDMFWIPSYETWLKNRDMGPAYEFHRSFLKHLQWLCPAERWVLKSSDHIHSLVTLIKTYPDARIIFLHRDPVRVLQSSSSQMTLLKAVFGRHVDPHLLGEYEAHILYEKVRKIMEFRDSHTHIESSFTDVRYLDLARDPLATVQAIYDCFGFSLSPEAGDRMEAFASAERNRRRPDKYSLAYFNLDPQQEDPHFDIYCERFKIGRETL